MKATIEVTGLRKRSGPTVALDGCRSRCCLGVLAAWAAAALLTGGLLLRLRDA